MPYIANTNTRNQLDDIINVYAGILQPNGNLNYLLYALCKRTITPGYGNYKNYIGELNECVAEIRRRLLADYEQGAIERNGDIT